MAAWHTDSFGKSYSCQKCSEMPDRKKIFGCTEKASRPTEAEEHEGMQYIYWNCPLQFVAPNIWEFFKVYKYMKDFSGAIMPAYKDLNPRFLQAYQYYETQKNLYLSKKVNNG